MTTAARPTFATGSLLVMMVLAIATPSARSAADPTDAHEPRSRVRRPVALARAGDGATLLVANGRAGTISVIDILSARCTAEHEVARALSDLAALPDGTHFLATDPDAGELLLLKRGSTHLTVPARLRLGIDPIRIAVLPDGTTCAITSRWGRRLWIVAIEPGNGEKALRLRHTLDLPFAPRDVVSLREGKALLVADAFGGRLAVVDPAEGTIASVRAIPGHNLRGLTFAPDGETVVIARQLSNRLATSSFDDVHWGDLMKNQVVTLRCDAILDPRADLLRSATTRDLDEVGHAASDPEALAIDSKGRTLVALAGVGELAILEARASSLVRVPVGTRPASVVLSSNGELACVADLVDDSVALVPLPGGAPRKISLGPRPPSTLIERGERLFTSAGLSHQGWMSCRSCHTDGHTNGLAVDTFGDTSYGTPKLVPSLLGVSSTGPWGWLGNFKTLEDQVRSSVETTMRGKPLNDGEVAAIAAYLRSLGPPPPLPLAREASTRGADVFREKKCAACHAGDVLTIENVKDVGLADESNHRAFNPPSLRGVGQRTRFLHDGRAATLDDVFTRHGHPPGATLTDREVRELVDYLHTL